jgi:hypothetical protein
LQQSFEKLVDQLVDEVLMSYESWAITISMALHIIM